MGPPPQHEGRVDPDGAIAYALATNDPNEIYEQGEAVPPLYTAALIQPAFASAGTAEDDPMAAVRNERVGVHAQHDVRFLCPLRPGDRVRWDVVPYSMRQTSAGVLWTRRIVVRSTDDTPLVEHYWSSMAVGGEIDADLGPPLDDHTFPPEARDRPLAVWEHTITGDQSFRYAGASGDRIGHSVDDDAARVDGFPRKVLQGLCTMAMCSGAVVAVGAEGDPSRLRRLAVRFAAPVFLRQQLAVAMYDGGTTDDGAGVIVFEATAGEALVIKHGRAELSPL